MGFKQQCCLIAGFLPGLFRQFAQLFDRLGLGCLEAVPFRVGILHLIPADR